MLTTVQVLACGHAGDRPEYFSDSGILHKTEKEQQELTKGVWFYEIAELAGMRTADQHAVKAFITRQEERARPAYGYFKEESSRASRCSSVRSTPTLTPATWSNI